MKLFEAIKSRRSIFPTQFNKKSIKNEDLELILEAANFAPTHKKQNHGGLKFYKMITKLNLLIFYLKNIKPQQQNSLNINFKKLSIM